MNLGGDEMGEILIWNREFGMELRMVFQWAENL